MKPAHREFPCSRGQREEGPRLVRVRQGDAQPKRESSDDGQGGDDRPSRPLRRSLSVAPPGAPADQRGSYEQRRPDEIELLLDAEGPVILQGRHRPVRVEVVGRLEGESVVADVQGTRHGVLGDHLHLEGTEHGDRDHNGDHDHEHGRRQEATGPPRVEAGERKATPR